MLLAHCMPSLDLGCVETPVTKTTHANALLELPVINPIWFFVSSCQSAQRIPQQYKQGLHCWQAERALRGQAVVQSTHMIAVNEGWLGIGA